MKDFHIALDHGNHKSATCNSEVYIKNTTKEITNGFQFPIEVNDAIKLKGVRTSPLEVVEQDKLNDKGSRLHKFLLCHDEYFDFTIRNSVDRLLIKDNLSPLLYGFCLFRLIYFMHTLLWECLSQPTLIFKANFKSVCRLGTM